MPEVCTIYVVRHGQSTHNRDHIVSGQVDPPLTDMGRRQAGSTKLKLAKVDFDEVYSSDLQRAADTAAIIAGKIVPKSRRLQGLRERSFGNLDGQSGKHLDNLRDKQQHIYNALSHEERWRYAHAPDIESDYRLATRFVSTLEKVATDNPGKTILVAAHGGTIRTMLIKIGYATLDQLPPRSFANAGYVKLLYDGHRFTVEQVEGLTKAQ